MKKILINMATIEGGGILTIWLLKFKRLQELGYDLTVFGGDFIKKLDLKKASVYDFNDSLDEVKKTKNKKWKKLEYMKYCLRKNLKSIFFHKKYLKENYAVIYSPSSVLDLVIFPYFYKKIKKDVRWVAIFDNIVSLNEPGNKTTRFLAWIFFKTSLVLLKKADKIFVISPELEKFMLEKGFFREQIVLSTNGVENELIASAKKDEKYRIDALFIGRINETKGIYDMLNVLEVVSSKYPCFQLAIMGVGDQSTEKQFKNKIKEMGLENNVQFLGYRTGQEKFNIIKSSKCFWFLSTSRSESFGIALLEAICSGVPSFAYNLPQFSWLYPNGEVSICPKGDWRQVAEKVLKFFVDGNFENQAGKKLLGKYSWERIAEQEFYQIRRLLQ